MKNTNKIIVIMTFVSTLILSMMLFGCSSDEEMPDVVGLTSKEAYETLQELGLNSTNIDYVDMDGKEMFSVGLTDAYIVEAQNPQAGETIDTYDYKLRVTLTVSNPSLEQYRQDQEAKDRERKEAAQARQAEETEKVAKWGEDYLKEDAAWAAFEQYGESVYPYGFKLHSIMGVIAEKQEDDGSWFLKCTADITNEYGAKRKDVTVEAQIAGTDSNPEVTYFYVYE